MHFSLLNVRHFLMCLRNCCLSHRRSWHGLTIPFFLTFCLQIYFRENFFISLLFHLFFLISTCSCQYSCNLMLTPNCMCRPYISLRVHLLHLISIMSFKLGHVSISKRRIFLPLFLLCA